MKETVKLDPICSVKLTKMVMPSIAGTVKDLRLVQEDDLTFQRLFVSRIREQDLTSVMLVSHLSTQNQ